MRQQRKRIQQKYKKDKSAKNLQQVIQIRNDLDSLIENTKTDYNSELIRKCAHNQGQLFKRVNSMLNRKDHWTSGRSNII